MSKPKDDGRPAFPQTGGAYSALPGMTLRQWYAGQALSCLGKVWIEGATSEDLAVECVRHADALLAELDKKEDQS